MHGRHDFVCSQTVWVVVLTAFSYTVLQMADTEDQITEDTDERRTADSLVENLTQQKTVVVGALEDLRHDLRIDRTEQALADLKARLDDKFSRIGKITTEQPETIYELLARQNAIVDEVNKLAD